MKMAKFAMMATVLVSSAVAMAGITQRDAQIAKERLSRCQYNDSVCVGNIIIDALASDRPDSYNPGNGGSNNGNSGRQNLVMVYERSDTCAGNVIATVVLDNDLQKNLQTCNSLNAVGNAAWSVSINGRCSDVPDASVKSACLQAINIITAGTAGK